MIDLVRYLFNHDCLLIYFLFEVLVLKLKVLSNDLDLVQVFILTFNMFSLGHYQVSILHAHIVFHFFVGEMCLTGLNCHLLGRIIFCG